MPKSSERCKEGSVEDFAWGSVAEDFAGLVVEFVGELRTPAMAEALGREKLIIRLKEASFDAGRFVATRDTLRRYEPEATFLSGSDNFVFESFVLGARGCLLSLAGIGGRLTEMLAAITRGDIDTTSRMNAERGSPLAEVMFAPAMRDNQSRIKEGLKHLGIIPCAAVRAPLRAVDERDYARMIAPVDGVFS